LQADTPQDHDASTDTFPKFHGAFLISQLRTVK
jgi:hypothetical protein